ncbi:hypothetical protein FRB90_000742 [Tulasnella sp. 427]|nr:hypothetical protein FRB90_000742 [Tulasnella sp. 427]
MSALQNLVRRAAFTSRTVALRALVRTFASSPTVFHTQDAEPLQSASSTTAGETLIRQKLETKFKPTRLDVQDVSASSAFKGLSMVKQHQLVQEELKKEIEGIHGLQLRTAVDS